MYYVMEHDTASAGEIVYFDDEPEGFEGDLLRTGEPLQQAAPMMTMIARDDQTGRLSDLLLCKADLQICSPKLMATLAAVGVDNIQYFPIRIVVSSTGSSREDYQVGNIVGKIPCVDFERAKVTRFRSGNIRSVARFSLLEDQIVPLPGTKTPPLIFRLGESEFIILAHESIKSACERDGITGAKFTLTQDFVG